MTKDTTTIAGRATSEGVDFDLAITGLDLSWEDAPLLHAWVAISWTDEENVDRQAVYTYTQWVSEGEIERVDRNDGWHRLSGDDLPDDTGYDIVNEVDRLIEGSGFDLRSLDATKEEANEALRRVNPDYVIYGRDPAHDHHWCLGERLGDGSTFLMGRWFKTLDDAIRWADRKVEERDAA